MSKLKNNLLEDVYVPEIKDKIYDEAKQSLYDILEYGITGVKISPDGTTERVNPVELIDKLGEQTIRNNHDKSSREEAK